MFRLLLQVRGVHELEAVAGGGGGDKGAIGKHGNVLCIWHGRDISAQFRNAFIYLIGMSLVRICGADPRQIVLLVPSYAPWGAIDVAVLVQANDIIGSVDSQASALSIGGKNNAIVAHRDASYTLANAQSTARAIISPIHVLNGGILAVNAYHSIVTRGIGHG